MACLHSLPDLTSSLFWTQLSIFEIFSSSDFHENLTLASLSTSLFTHNLAFFKSFFLLLTLNISVSHGLTFNFNLISLYKLS